MMQTSEILMFLIYALLIGPSVSSENLPTGVQGYLIGSDHLHLQKPRLSVIYPDKVERYFYADSKHQLTSGEHFECLRRESDSIHMMPDVIRLYDPNREDRFVHLTQDGAQHARTVHTRFMEDLRKYNNFNHAEYIEKTERGNKIERKGPPKYPPHSFLEYEYMDSRHGKEENIYPRDEAHYESGHKRNIMHVWGVPERTSKYWMIFRRKTENNQQEMPGKLYSLHAPFRGVDVHLPVNENKISPEAYSKKYDQRVQEIMNAGNKDHSNSTSS